MTTFKIHRAEIMPGAEDEDEPVLLCLIEVQGQVYENFLFPVDNFETAYTIQKHCRTNIEPFEIEMDGGLFT